jgi:uncharacterized protein (DUF302 family)
MSSYYFSKTLDVQFEDAISLATEALKKEGFGVLTEIRIHDKLKEKLDVDFPRYTILGACNPAFAYKALQAENKIGTMLPCNVIVRETEEGRIEVAAVNPIESMKAIENPMLGAVAIQVTEILKRVIEGL